MSENKADPMRIPLADHDEIGRKIIGQPWAIQSAIVTIAAHCTVLVDGHPTGDVADLAGCISECCAELATALAAPQPAAPSDFERAFTDACDEIGCPHDNEALLQAIADLKKPAAPLGGREAIARIIWSYEYGYEPDEYQIERSNPGKKCLGIAGAILAAIPQERVDRAAIIAECVKAAESVEMGRKWSDDPDMQNQGYYTEGEILVEIVDAIRALGKETGR